MNLDDLRDLNQAAEELGLAPVSLRNAIARGRFAARKFGNAWVTTRQEVERYRSENLGNRGRPRSGISGTATGSGSARGHKNAIASQPKD